MPLKISPELKQPPIIPSTPTATWTCPDCETINDTMVCSVCGKSKTSITPPPPPPPPPPPRLCPDCGRSLPIGAMSCPSCGWGTTTRWTCANCGAKNGMLNAACRTCGVSRGTPPIKHNNSGMMAWSIVTLLLCVIPGIVAITKVSKANATHSEDEAQGYLQSAKKWNIAGCIIGVLAIIGMLSNGSLGGSTSTAPKVTQAPSTYNSQPYTQSTPKPTTAPSQTSDAAEEHLANARRLVSKGDYYGAFTEIV